VTEAVDDRTRLLLVGARRAAELHALLAGFEDIGAIDRLAHVDETLPPPAPPAPAVVLVDVSDLTRRRAVAVVAKAVLRWPRASVIAALASTTPAVAVIESLAAALEAKDSVTSLHLRRASRLAVRLAERVDPALARSEDFRFGCLLHDVGKVGVPARILSKPGALTADEWVVVRRHPQAGARVVRPLGLSATVLDVVLAHHERWDGTGYPDGLAGGEIPLAARIFAVCDALEAMTAQRPYRRALSAEEAFARVRAEAGRQFDPEIVAALEDAVDAGEIDLDEPDGPAGDARELGLAASAAW